jgi:hypothetical protein
MADVNLSASGPPSTVLPDEPAERLAALRAAIAQTDIDRRRAALADVVRRWPRFLDGWAHLGANARDDIEAYAYFRVGYHRGLDTLRANGWRGSGYVRWSSESNRGFLRSLRGLQQVAERIGESDEAERCRHFLAQCDPTGVPAEG